MAGVVKHDMPVRLATTRSSTQIFNGSCVTHPNWRKIVIFTAKVAFYLVPGKCQRVTNPLPTRESKIELRVSTISHSFRDVPDNPGGVAF